jgi:hypothetical protein
MGLEDGLEWFARACPYGCMLPVMSAMTLPRLPRDV